MQLSKFILFLVAITCLYLKIQTFPSSFLEKGSYPEDKNSNLLKISRTFDLKIQAISELHDFVYIMQF